jgi:acyl-CoA synthetase (AMP-forming)/AMP-acid ligase II
MTFPDFIDAVRARALTHPERTAYTFLVDGEQDERCLAYAELDRRARAVAVWLQRHKLAGERVLLLYDSGLEYIVAFLGCLYAGAAAVPVYPPRSKRTIARLQAVAADAQAAAALGPVRVIQGAAALPGFDRLQHADVETLDLNLADDWSRPPIDQHTVAFLQYTSGSTAEPRGVQVSHGNLVHNQAMIEQAFRHDDRTIVAGWLPLFHDMGLVGMTLQPLFLGLSCVFMSPAAFLQRPLRWLDAISRYGATTSGGPNFAYDLCVRTTTPAQRATLNLSTWTVAFNGAEPVRAETMARFTEAF